MQTLVDLKGKLLARQANQQAAAQHHAEQVVILEAQLAGAKRAQAEASGEVRATAQALADLEASLGQPPAGDQKQ